jgi:hypothetical protein
MFFYTGYPQNGDPDALTLANSDNTAAALKVAVDGLATVTASTLTLFTVSGGSAQPLFDADKWASFIFSITLPTEFGGNSDSAQLTSASPADGKLTAADLATVTSVLVTFIETLPTVTACTVTQQTVIPSTAITFAPSNPAPVFTEVGPPISPTVSSKTFTLVPTAVGDFILLGVVCTGTTADWATALSSAGGNVTWSAPVPHFASGSSGNNVTEAVFIGHVIIASSHLVTITTNAGSPTIRAGGQEFFSSAGFSAVTLDASGTIDVASAGKFAAVTPDHGAGDLYWSFIYNNGIGVAGTTSGYRYHLDSNGNLQTYNLLCASTLQQPGIGDTNGTSGIAVMLYA